MWVLLKCNLIQVYWNIGTTYQLPCTIQQKYKWFLVLCQLFWHESVVLIYLYFQVIEVKNSPDAQITVRWKRVVDKQLLCLITLGRRFPGWPSQNLKMETWNSFFFKYSSLCTVSLCVLINLLLFYNNLHSFCFLTNYSLGICRLLDTALRPFGTRSYLWNNSQCNSFRMPGNSGRLKANVIHLLHFQNGSDGVLTGKRTCRIISELPWTDQMHE